MINHHLDHVFSVADRFAVVKNRALTGVVRTAETTHGNVVAMIISGIVSGRIPRTA